MCASFPSTLPASGRPETDAHMQVVVVSGEDLDDSWRPAKTRVRTDEDSLRLQSIGIGGRRAMGCGIFNAILNHA